VRYGKYKDLWRTSPIITVTGTFAEVEGAIPRNANGHIWELNHDTKQIFLDRTHWLSEPRKWEVLAVWKAVSWRLKLLSPNTNEWKTIRMEQGDHIVGMLLMGNNNQGNALMSNFDPVEYPESTHLGLDNSQGKYTNMRFKRYRFNNIPRAVFTEMVHQEAQVAYVIQPIHTMRYIVYYKALPWVESQYLINQNHVADTSQNRAFFRGQRYYKVLKDFATALQLATWHTYAGGPEQTAIIWAVLVPPKYYRVKWQNNTESIQVDDLILTDMIVVQAHVSHLHPPYNLEITHPTDTLEITTGDEHWHTASSLRCCAIPAQTKIPIMAADGHRQEYRGERWADGQNRNHVHTPWNEIQTWARTYSTLRNMGFTNVRRIYEAVGRLPNYLQPSVEDIPEQLQAPTENVRPDVDKCNNMCVLCAQEECCVHTRKQFHWCLCKQCQRKQKDHEIRHEEGKSYEDTPLPFLSEHIHNMQDKLAVYNQVAYDDRAIYGPFFAVVVRITDTSVIIKLGNQEYHDWKNRHKFQEGDVLHVFTGDHNIYPKQMGATIVPNQLHNKPCDHLGTYKKRRRDNHNNFTCITTCSQCDRAWICRESDMSTSPYPWSSPCHCIRYTIYQLQYGVTACSRCKVKWLDPNAITITQQEDQYHVAKCKAPQVWTSPAHYIQIPCRTNLIPAKKWNANVRKWITREEAHQQLAGTVGYTKETLNEMWTQWPTSEITKSHDFLHGHKQWYDIEVKTTYHDRMIYNKNFLEVGDHCYNMTTHMIGEVVHKCIDTTTLKDVITQEESEVKYCEITIRMPEDISKISSIADKMLAEAQETEKMPPPQQVQLLPRNHKSLPTINAKFTKQEAHSCMPQSHEEAFTQGDQPYYNLHGEYKDWKICIADLSKTTKDNVPGGLQDFEALGQKPSSDKRKRCWTIFRTWAMGKIGHEGSCFLPLTMRAESIREVCEKYSADPKHAQGYTTGTHVVVLGGHKIGKRGIIKAKDRFQVHDDLYAFVDWQDPTEEPMQYAIKNLRSLVIQPYNVTPAIGTKLTVIIAREMTGYRRVGMVDANDQTIDPIWKGRYIDSQKTMSIGDRYEARVTDQHFGPDEMCLDLYPDLERKYAKDAMFTRAHPGSIRQSLKPLLIALTDRMFELHRFAGRYINWKAHVDDHTYTVCVQVIQHAKHAMRKEDVLSTVPPEAVQKRAWDDLVHYLWQQGDQQKIKTEQKDAQIISSTEPATQAAAHTDSSKGTDTPGESFGSKDTPVFNDAPKKQCEGTTQETRRRQDKRHQQLKQRKSERGRGSESAHSRSRSSSRRMHDFVEIPNKVKYNQKVTCNTCQSAPGQLLVCNVCGLGFCEECTSKSHGYQCEVPIHICSNAPSTVDEVWQQIVQDGRATRDAKKEGNASKLGPFITYYLNINKSATVVWLHEVLDSITRYLLHVKQWAAEETKDYVVTQDKDTQHAWDWCIQRTLDYQVHQTRNRSPESSSSSRKRGHQSPGQRNGTKESKVDDTQEGAKGKRKGSESPRTHQAESPRMKDQQASKRKRGAEVKIEPVEDDKREEYTTIQQIAQEIYANPRRAEQWLGNHHEVRKIYKNYKLQPQNKESCNKCASDIDRLIQNSREQEAYDATKHSGPFTEYINRNGQRERVNPNKVPFDLRQEYEEILRKDKPLSARDTRRVLEYAIRSYGEDKIRLDLTKAQRFDTTQKDVNFEATMGLITGNQENIFIPVNPTCAATCTPIHGGTIHNKQATHVEKGDIPSTYKNRLRTWHGTSIKMLIAGGECVDAWAADLQMAHEDWTKLKASETHKVVMDMSIMQHGGAVSGVNPEKARRGVWQWSNFLDAIAHAQNNADDKNIEREPHTLPEERGLVLLQCNQWRVGDKPSKLCTPGDPLRENPACCITGYVVSTRIFGELFNHIPATHETVQVAEWATNDRRCKWPPTRAPMPTDFGPRFQLCLHIDKNDEHIKQSEVERKAYEQSVRIRSITNDKVWPQANAGFSLPTHIMAPVDEDTTRDFPHPDQAPEYNGDATQAKTIANPANRINKGGKTAIKGKLPTTLQALGAREDCATAYAIPNTNDLHQICGRCFEEGLGDISLRYLLHIKERKKWEKKDFYDCMYKPHLPKYEQYRTHRNNQQEVWHRTTLGLLPSILRTGQVKANESDGKQIHAYEDFEQALQTSVWEPYGTTGYYAMAYIRLLTQDVAQDKFNGGYKMIKCPAEHTHTHT